MKIKKKTIKKLRHKLEDARLILDTVQRDVFIKESAHTHLDRVYELLTLVEASLEGKRGKRRSKRGTQKTLGSGETAV
jgi:hypothetical protein